MSAPLLSNRIPLGKVQLSENLLEKYQAFLLSTIDSNHVPPEILLSCKTRIRQIHGLEEESIDGLDVPVISSSLDESAQKTALVIAEKITFDVHGIDDGEMDELKRFLGEPGCVQLITALAFFDVESRLERVLGAF
ncbi:MAG: hypothetical protein CMQ40_02585 [Gammaproteobacteria bacterium]|nr:hypothetical protein [Gammaproteobacteria bacterium]